MGTVKNESISLPEQGKALGVMAGTIPKERFPELVAWLFPLIGNDDRENMTRIWQMVMPPPAFTGVKEVISYQIPMFKYHGPLVFFAAFKNHCSFYVVSKPIMEVFTSELKPWDTSGTTIHFSAKNPLPASLVKNIVKARIEENEAKAKNTKTQ